MHLKTKWCGTNRAAHLTTQQSYKKPTKFPHGVWNIYHASFLFFCALPLSLFPMIEALPHPPLLNDPTGGQTYQHQSKLSKLPIPDLQGTIERYLAAVKPLQVKRMTLGEYQDLGQIYWRKYHLQSAQEHEKTKVAAENFLKNEGPWLQEQLKAYAADKMSYIEEFW